MSEFFRDLLDCHVSKATVHNIVHEHLEITKKSTGKTGLSIIQAIIRGERNPIQLASYREKNCKKSTKEIAKALEGNWREEHLFALRQAYEAYEFYHKQIIECEDAIQKIVPTLTPAEFSVNSLGEGPTNEFDQFLPNSEIIKTKKKCSYNRSPYHFDVAKQMHQLLGINLTEIPGIEGNSLLAILSEIGTDMSKWPTVKHFTSWLGLCPGSKISGGKILSGKTKPTNNRAAHAFRLAANIT